MIVDLKISAYIRIPKQVLMKIRHKVILVLLFMCFSVGAAAKTKIPVHVFELGQKITEQLAKNYAGSLVRSAWKVNTNNVWSYEIRIIRGNMEYALLYDKNGEFLRKETVSPVVAEKKPILRKKQPKPFLLQQLDSLQLSNSLVLRY